MTYDDFLVYVMPSVSNCPEPLAIQHIRLAAREFCAKTLVWQEVLDDIIADGTSTDYAMPIDSEVDLVKLLSVSIADEYRFEVVDALRGRSLARNRRMGDYAYTPDRQRLVVSFAPDEGKVITVEAALQPSLGSLTFPDDLFGQHVQDIANGAVASLMMLPKKDWSDPSTGAANRALFNDRVSTAAVKTSLGFGASRPKVKAHFF